MGVGFAAFVALEAVASTLAAAQATGHDAWVAGQVKRAGGCKAVTIPSLGLSYEADTFQVR
jgi:phosphoribosylformylglycinamidine cyclo-ligase